ncbi:PREDICTED: putative F-box/LRR-repeat protein At3g18150 [Camelina sativa]|uniref:F-box/LRR-repeat protein At3g18150 n=1 Tax=Camelina sativa TaxID=90675 RepID=A0ABM0ZBP7_CAMSA|nr:PREDICTED: putative F-box/LRR-repeat protein At3g18150 [Camelina sativa]
MDLISSLPDAILQHILFFVPTQLAITTSILSRRWRHVWSDTPSLSFDDSYGPPVHAAWINETLTRYTAPKMIKFHLNTRMNPTVSSMNRWIQFAMSRNVENLSLCVGIVGDYKYSIPDFFWTSSSIKQLNFELPYSYIIPSCSVSWTSLKKLSLSNCYLSDESLAKILCGCPILESLKLNHCLHLSVLDLSKSLGVRTIEIACTGFVSGPMQIVAPHVHSLRLHNFKPPCALVDVSSLTEARVDVSCHSVRETLIAYLFQFLREMLEKLQNAEKLTFGCNILQNYCDDCVGVGGWRSKDGASWNRSHWELESKRVASFVKLVLKNANALDKMVLQLYGDYPRFKFEELVQTLPHNNTISIVLSTRQNGTHHMSGES